MYRWMCLETNHIQYVTPKVEENRTHRHSWATEGHLNSCLHLQTQDTKDRTYLVSVKESPSPKKWKCEGEKQQKANAPTGHSLNVMFLIALGCPTAATVMRIMHLILERQENRTAIYWHLAVILHTVTLSSAYGLNVSPSLMSSMLCRICWVSILNCSPSANVHEHFCSPFMRLT